MGWLLRLVTGGPTGGKGPPTALEFLVINFRDPDLRKWRGPGWLRYASEHIDLYRDSRASRGKKTVISVHTLPVEVDPVTRRVHWSRRDWLQRN